MVIACESLNLGDKQIVVEITGQQRGWLYSFNRYINLFVS